MTVKRRPRAVGYVRVSTEEQVDNHSLRAQQREIERYCERKGCQGRSWLLNRGLQSLFDSAAIQLVP